MKEIKFNENMFSQLNPDYNFDSFVTGQCNLSAIQTTKAIVKSLAQIFNPVYVYGPTGVGKTHLFHAIGNYVTTLHSDINAKCISCRMYIEAILEELHEDRGLNSAFNRFRFIDFLMVEDLQYLYSKERTQEMLLDAIKSFICSGKQIVLSSSCSP